MSVATVSRKFCCLRIWTLVSKNLDEIDLKILSEIQADGRITNVELARRVGISPPPCLRRVRTLEEAGYIQGYRGLLDPRLLGFDVTVFASVHLSSQADGDLRAFEDFVRAEPLVRECWMLSGEVDFILKCVAPDMATFQDFVTHLTRGAKRAQRPHLAGAAQLQERRRGAAGAEGGGLRPKHRRHPEERALFARVSKDGRRRSSPSFEARRRRRAPQDDGIACCETYTFFRIIASRLHGPGPAAAR